METKQFEIFTLVKTDKEKVKVICGNNLMTNKEFKDYEEAKKYLKKKPYEVIINLVHLVYDYEQKNKETAKAADADK